MNWLVNPITDWFKSWSFEPVWNWLMSESLASLLQPMTGELGASALGILAAVWFMALVLLIPGTGALRLKRILLGVAISAAVLVLVFLPLGVSLALELAGLTIWTYVGVKNARPRRVLALLALRLAALAIACLLILRPSRTTESPVKAPSVLIITVDGSGSMNIQDELGDRSRWDRVLAILRSPRCAELLTQLRTEKNVRVVYYKGTDDIAIFDPLEKPGAADGKRTPLGQWLHSIYQRHARETNLRAIVLFSDGADNGLRYQPGDEAEQFQRIPCPIYTFLVGHKETSLQRQSLAFDPASISVNPSPVGVKQKMTVQARLIVNGYQNPKITLRLYLDEDAEPVTVKEVRLDKPVNENSNVYDVEVTCNAPPRPREMKVTLKVDPLPNQVNPRSTNAISTYVTVTKEGISVLYVEGTLRWEARFIRDALNAYPGLRLYKAFRTRDETPDADWFQFDKRHYDVIIIGDISAHRFSGGNPRVFAKIKELVTREGTGLLMLRGDNTFLRHEVVDGEDRYGPSDWGDFGKPVADLLPIDLKNCGNLPDTEEVRVVPTQSGLDHYLMRLSAKNNLEIWTKTFEPLKGMTLFGKLRPGVTVLAENKDTRQPVLVYTRRGDPRRKFNLKTDKAGGRVLVFACDGTWDAWRRNWDAVKAHQRFWQQVVVWLAQQENKDDNIWVKTETRRLPVGGKLDFQVGMRGKDDQIVKDARFDVKVTSPDRKTTAVQTIHAPDQEHGLFGATDAAGEYRLQATLLDKNGKPDPKRTKQIRFLVYEDDMESHRPAADPDTMDRIARKSDGESYRASEERFAHFLEELLHKPLPPGSRITEVWPDWHLSPQSSALGDQIAALWQAGILPLFLLFVTLVCAEWGLRRYWGLV